MLVEVENCGGKLCCDVEGVDVGYCVFFECVMK